MEPQRPRGISGWVVGGVVVLAVTGVLVAFLDFGSLDQPELDPGPLIAQGDETCRRAHEAFVDLQRLAPATAGDAAELTGRLIAIASDEADKIGSLNGPPDFDAAIDDYIAAREDGIDAMRAGRDAAEDRDADGYARSQDEVADARREAREIARRIGFTVCSRPIEPAR